MRGCIDCRRRLPQIKNQIMAPLPDFRVVGDEKRLEAFDQCGIDAAGPYFVKVGRGQA